MSENIAGRAIPLDRADSAIPFVSREIMFYAAIFIVALLLRVASLDGAPHLSEVPYLLAALRAEETTSPLLFWVQSLSFMIFGANMLAAHLVTALAGIGLAFTPVMFRRELGHTRAAVLTLLLAFSAPMIITAREAAPAVWAALFAVFAIRAWLTYLQNRAGGTGIAAVVLSAILILLTDPSGVLFALCATAGAALTVLWGAGTADSEDEAQTGLNSLRDALKSVSWGPALAAAVLVVFAIATGFMTLPSGFGNIAALLGGIAQLPVGSGSILGVSIFYELILWGLGVTAVVLAWRNGFSAADRFFLGWLLAGLVMTLVLPGLAPQHTLLVSLPLAGLVSLAVSYAFVPDRRQQILSEQYSADGDELALLISPPAGRLILSLMIFALLFILITQLGTTAREFLQVEDGSITGMIDRMQQQFTSSGFRVGLLWSFISAMFVLVGYFLAGSIWNNRVAVQGYILGFLLMAFVTQISGSWYASVQNADNAAEPWHHEAVGVSYQLMERTLYDLTMRETQGLPLLPITVIRDEATGLSENGLMAWMLRDFNKVTWVNTEAEAKAAPIVIAPQNLMVLGEQTIALGGSYVGQPFTLTRIWSPAYLANQDVVTWFLQRNTRVVPPKHQAVVLWVRQDVFESVPVQDLFN